MDYNSLLEKYRAEADEITEELVLLVLKRSELVSKLFELKKKESSPLVDKAREEEIIEDARKLASEKGVNPELIEKIMVDLIEDNKKKV